MYPAIRILPLLLLAACSPSEQVSTPKAAPADTSSPFALSLLQQTARTEPGNISLCPYSAAMALSLLEPGASDTTRKELHGILGNTSFMDKAVRSSSLYIETANRIHVASSYRLNPAYTAKVPLGSVISVDFQGNPEQARTDINRWVEGETRGLIRDLLSPGQISSETELAAVNTVYLKNRWDDEFDDALTCDAPFTLADGTVKQVSTMHQTNDYPCVITEEYNAIILPFVYRCEPDSYELMEKSGMIFILPPEGVAIDDFIRTLTPEKLAEIQKRLTVTYPNSSLKKVELSLPRFRIDTEADLIPLMKAMGMQATFSSTEGFPEITEEKKPFGIDTFIQKCTISIDEEGAEAAAASLAVPTAGIDGKLEDLPIPFHLDRPFIWLAVPSMYSTSRADIDNIPAAYCSYPVFIGLVKEPRFPATAPKKRKKHRDVFIEAPPQKLQPPPLPKRLTVINASEGIDLPDETWDCMEGLNPVQLSEKEAPAPPSPH